MTFNYFLSSRRQYLAVPVGNGRQIKILVVLGLGKDTWANDIFTTTNQLKVETSREPIFSCRLMYMKRIALKCVPQATSIPLD